MVDPQPTDSPTEPADAAATPNRGPITALLAVLGLVVVVIVVVLVTRGDDSNPVDDVSAALASNAALLAGPRPATDLQHARCTEESEGRYSCKPVVDNTAGGKPLTVNWDGTTLTKRLAGTNLTAAPRGGDEVAAALIADEQATLGRTVKYGCAFTQSMSPGGGPATGPGGFRCATLKPLPGESEVLQRYVEFASDGSVTRDFMLTSAA